MRIWFIAALTGLLGYIGFASFKQPENGDKERVILTAVVKVLGAGHFTKMDYNDAFSEKLYHTYLDRLDGSKRFLIMSDLDLMDDYQDSLDDQIQIGDLRFFDLSYEIINKSIEKTRKWYPEILSKPFDFSIKDSIETDGEKRSYAKDDAELKNSGAPTSSLKHSRDSLKRSRTRMRCRINRKAERRL